MVGPNVDEFGTRFPNLSEVYRLGNELDLAILAKAPHIPIQYGVYAGLLGPSYETPAEVKMLQVLRADVCGMSMVHEAIAAAHCGMNVIGLSVIANKANHVGSIDHCEVERIVSKAAPFVREVINIALKEII